VCDVHQIGDMFGQLSFDVIYLLSSFYSFRDQQQALTALAAVAKPDAQLVIFDYLALPEYDNENPFRDDSSKPFMPIKENISQMLDQAGFLLVEIIYLNTEFIC
jgi:ubiquinone/menaquinone biosynthesis C-methylase UbiE